MMNRLYTAIDYFNRNSVVLLTTGCDDLISEVLKRTCHFKCPKWLRWYVRVYGRVYVCVRVRVCVCKCNNTRYKNCDSLNCFLQTNVGHLWRWTTTWSITCTAWRWRKPDCCSTRAGGLRACASRLWTVDKWSSSETTRPTSSNPLQWWCISEVFHPCINSGFYSNPWWILWTIFVL